ncbi:hypothetical protein CEP52_010394 [Fusarium oligoseptatum]|uniref:Fungal N-terminal domain-containing protein n=1 Tax=Fusarium oligoseptatum TaxID=2604345 RepID=A0A428T8K8_9HYPO|nr:hypothetical protein CEP52_010394 [Fusarium oligoseptatum]
MAEALGIASGVAGIVSLGITICSGLDTYFSAIKDRDDDLKRATELLSLLRRYIELIRPSASTLGSRHAQATDLVVLALGSCEGELRALKELVDNLNKIDGSSDVARKWDKSKSVIAYPFQRKKLTQVQDQLLKATGALGTVIQALILHVGVGVGDDIEAFRNAVQDNHLVTTAFLTRLESKVEMIGSSTKHTESAVTAISIGVDEQRAVASSSQELIKDTSLMVSGRLDALAQGSCLGPQSRTVGTAQQRDIPRYLRNAMIESKSVQESNTEICPCQKQGGATVRQPSATYTFWGGLSISHRAMLKASHEPGCCFYKTSTKTTITYNGLRFLLSKVLSLSLQRDYQPGGCLTTLSLRTYNVREESPSLELFFRPFDWGNNVKNMVEEHMKQLQTIYSSGEASPFDVNTYGWNVAHLCIQYYNHSEVTKRSDNIESVKTLLRFLQRVGVNIHTGTDHHSSMLEFVYGTGRYIILGPVYDVLTSCEPQFDPELDHKRARHIMNFNSEDGHLTVVHDRPDIMEDLGYKNLFLAVSKRDEARLKELIKSSSFTENLDERAYFGQNILHLCLKWETGLRLLLEQEATHHLVNQPDAAGMTPLANALEISGYARCVPCRPDLGSDCGCSAIVELLLETDCPVGLDLFDRLDAWTTSPRAMIVLLEHLGQRRRRLQKLALQHLPEADLRDLGVSRNQLPDATAPAIWEKLQSLHQSGAVKILHNGLNPSCGSWMACQSRLGIFHLLRDPGYAEVAFNLGFKGIDTPDSDGVTPIMYSCLRYGSFDPTEVQLLYADWLIKKGARLDHCTNSLGISTAHDLAHTFGEWVRFKFSLGWEHVQPSTKIVPVLPALLYSTAQSRLPCPCATEELSRPLHHFVVSSLNYMDKDASYWPWQKPDHIARHTITLAIQLVGILCDIANEVDVTYLAKSIIRVLTMRALGVRHLPRCHESAKDPEEKIQRVKEEEEWDEILDEDRVLIEKLDELTGEFEQEFSSQNLSIEEFLRLHWHPRIRQVQRENKALVESQRQQLRQLGVVLDAKCEQYLDYDQDWNPVAWCGHGYGDADSGDADYEDEDSEDEDTETEQE